MSELEKKPEETAEAPVGKKADTKLRSLIELVVLLIAIGAVCIVCEVRKVPLWCRIRAELGSAEMQYRVGVDYVKRNDTEKAKKYLRKAADQGNVKAAIALSELLDDNAECEKLLLPFAEKGDADAQFVLGRCFEQEGKKKDAVKWFTLAAKNAQGEAAVTLADSYLSGNAEAIRVLLPAAEKGSAEAQLRLADRYFRIGNKEEAAKWCEKAVAKGGVEAQLKLADFLHQNGRLDEAAMWYEKAAGQGDGGAELALDRFYRQTKQYDRLAKWYEKGAEKGSADAMFALGLLYYYGKDEYSDGIPRDLAKAKSYIGKAAAKGHPRAADKLVEVEAAIKNGGKIE